MCSSVDRQTAEHIEEVVKWVKSVQRFLERSHSGKHPSRTCNGWSSKITLIWNEMNRSNTHVVSGLLPWSILQCRWYCSATCFLFPLSTGNLFVVFSFLKLAVVRIIYSKAIIHRPSDCVHNFTGVWLVQVWKIMPRNDLPPLFVDNNVLFVLEPFTYDKGTSCVASRVSRR